MSAQQHRMQGTPDVTLRQRLNSCAIQLDQKCRPGLGNAGLAVGMQQSPPRGGGGGGGGGTWRRADPEVSEGAADRDGRRRSSPRKLLALRKLPGVPREEGARCRGSAHRTRRLRVCSTSTGELLRTAGVPGSSWTSPCTKPLEPAIMVCSASKFQDCICWCSSWTDRPWRMMRNSDECRMSVG